VGVCVGVIKAKVVLVVDYQVANHLFGFFFGKTERVVVLLFLKLKGTFQVRKNIWLKLYTEAMAQRRLVFKATSQPRSVCQYS